MERVIESTIAKVKPSHKCFSLVDDDQFAMMRPEYRQSTTRVAKYSDIGMTTFKLLLSIL